MYPNIIAQCVYSAFIYAYPNSWNGFDDSFKAELCTYISEWQVGTKPIPSSWMLWDLSALEPPNLPKMRDPKDDIRGNLKAQGKFDLDALVKEAKEARQKETEKRIMAKLEASFGRKFSVMAVKRALSGSKCAISSLIGPSPPKQTEEFASAQDGILTTASEERRLTLAIEQLAAIEKISTSRVRLLTRHSRRHRGVNSPSPHSSSSRPISPLRFLDPQTSPNALSPRLSPRRSGSLGALTFEQQRYATSPTKSSFADTGRRRGTVHAVKITKMDEDESEAMTATAEEGFGTPQKAVAVTKGKKQPARPDSAVSTTKSKAPPTGTAAHPSLKQWRGTITTMTTAAQLKKTKKFVAIPGQASTPPTKHKSHSAHPKLATGKGAYRRSLLASKGGEEPPPRAATATALSTTTSPRTRRTRTGELKKMALSFKDRRPESATLKGPEFERVMFNLHGHSPLVKHYLNTMRLSHISEKEVVVGRTEISEEPPHDAVCYRDVLAESKAAGDKNQELFDKYDKLL